MTSKRGTPSTEATASSSTRSAAKARSWSSSESASRTLPSAARAMVSAALAVSAKPSCPAISSRRDAIRSVATGRNSSCWQRDRIVAGILCRSVVAKTQST